MHVLGVISNYASLVCLRLRFVIFASFEMVDFGFLWDLRADEYIQRLASSRCTDRRDARPPRDAQVYVRKVRTRNRAHSFSS